MRYIGSKVELLDFIDKAVEETGVKSGTFLDLFSGTSSVAQHYKKKGYKAISNDLLYFSYCIQQAFIKNNELPEFKGLTQFKDQEDRFQQVLDYLNNLKGKKGYYFNSFSSEGKADRMYFSSENGKMIDSITSQIHEWKDANLITDSEFFILKTSLLEAVSKVSNISGTYGAFLKTWDKRALKKIKLEKMDLITSNKLEHEVYNEDGLNLVKRLEEVDICYLDPPYNTRQYSSNYHVLENIAINDKIDLKGKTGTRDDDGKGKSDFAKIRECQKAFKDLI